MKACDCLETLGNTGEAGCKPLFGVTKKVIFVNKYKADGTPTRLLISTLITPAVLTALLNNADPYQRFYPSPLLENVGGARADATYETAASGRKAFVKEGVRTTTAEVWGQGSEYKANLDQNRCADLAAYVVDIYGNLRGMILAEPDGYLYPIDIDNESFYTKLLPATDTTNEKLLITFDWAQTEEDANLRMILAGDMTANWLRAAGLLDISAEYSNITTTTLKAKLKTRYGSVASPIVDSGLVIGDFTMYNNTTPGAVALVAAAPFENPKGSYNFTFAAQSSGDELVLTPVKAGRDYAEVVANEIAIP